MSKTEVSGKQVKDGSIELVDLSTALSNTISGKADSASLATVATSGDYNDLSNKPSIPSRLDDLIDMSVGAPGDKTSLVFHPEAGPYGEWHSEKISYDDLINTPSIPSVAGLASETYVDNAVAGKADSSSLATVATSGSYADLTGKPTLFDGAYSSLSGAPSIPGKLDDLSDVTITSPSSDQVLKYNGTAWVNSAAPAAGATDLDGLSDVAVSSAAKGQFIVHNGTQFVNSNTIEASGAAVKPLIVKGAASQTADLLEVQNSSALSLFSVDKDGLITAYGFKTTAGGGVSVTGLGTGASSYSSAGVHLNANQSAYGVIDLVGNNGGFIDFAAVNEDFHGRMLYDRGQHGYYFYSRADATPKVCIDREGYGTLFAQPHSAAVKGIIVKGAASQTGNYYEAQDGNGVSVFHIASTTSGATKMGAVLNLKSDGTTNASPYYLKLGTPTNSRYGMFCGIDTGAEAFSTLIGAGAGFRFVGATSGYNVAVGTDAMFGSTGGGQGSAQEGVCVGYKAGTALRGGNANTFVGSWAGSAITSGVANVMIGSYAGSLNTTGNYSIHIGYGASALATAVTANNMISIGYAAKTDGAESIAIGSSASAAANCLDLRFGGATRISGDSSGNITIAQTLHAKRYTETVANAFNTSLAPSSGTLTVDTSTGNAVLGALNAAVTTWAFTNVPTDNSKVTTVTAVLAGNASYTYGDACSVNGSAVTNGIMWSGGSAPTATAGTDIITFIIVKDSAGTVKVFGSATTNFS